MLPPLWIPQKRPKKRGRPTGLEGGIGHPHQAKRQADGLISGAAKCDSMGFDADF